MRGSPLIRTVIVLLALVLTAAGLASLRRPPGPPPPPAVPPGPPVETIATPFFLTLSAPASRVTLESAGEILEIEPEGSTRLAGTLPLESGHPVLFIDIVWRDPADAPRFAKLVLEPPGHPTATRIFDATGALSDVWELHLHP